MVNITLKPYFNHNDAIIPLMEPLQSLVDIRLIGYSRMFANRERFLICPFKDWGVDFFTISQLYRYGLYEKPQDIPSGYNMWDHLPYAPPEIYLHNRKKFNIAHGLTIIQQHGDYCDSFVFATHPGNNQINNFYLNQKDLFTAFTKDFYDKMAPTLTDLVTQTFMIPANTTTVSNPVLTLTPRQQDCARLLIEGITAKEIARVLQVSHRTVESHINLMKDKFQAKNRVQLIGTLGKML